MTHLPKSSPRWLASAGAGFILSALCALPVAAATQGTEHPVKKGAQTTHAHASTGSDSKVLHGIQRGTDAAGRSIYHADAATRRGIENTSERASAPVRRWGEALGRKLPRVGWGHEQASVGPQGNAP